jgi:hypothetical protein
MNMRHVNKRDGPCIIHTRGGRWHVETKGAMELVAGEQDVTSEISLIPTPGHTPGHRSIVIASGGERTVLISDVAHHPAQVHETGSLVAACHSPHPEFRHLVRVEGKRVFRAL